MSNSPASTSSHRRDSILLGVAVGVVGVTFGVLADSAGLSPARTMAMSLLVFTGASQFLAVGVVASGGSAVSAVTGALLLGARNAMYGMRMSPILGPGAVRRAAASQLVIDESTAMSLAQDNIDDSRDAFWVTGLAVYLFWNLGTAGGVWLGDVVGEPAVWGLDAAFPASFVALIGPHIVTKPGQVAAVLAAAIALLAVPFTPAGLPVLLAALAVGPALAVQRRSHRPTGPAGVEGVT